jgi:hypothetical protein
MRKFYFVAVFFTFLAIFNSIEIIPVIAAGTPVITQTRPIDFGSFVSGVAGKITITKTSSSATTGVIVLTNGLSAAFSISGGTSLQPITIIVDSAFNLSNGSGGSMTFTNTVYNKPTKLTSSGTGAFWVGGKLTINTNQQPGTYSGSYNISYIY